jgi:hypothetical protein
MKAWLVLLTLLFTALMSGQATAEESCLIDGLVDNLRVVIDEFRDVSDARIVSSDQEGWRRMFVDRRTGMTSIAVAEFTVPNTHQITRKKFLQAFNDETLRSVSEKQGHGEWVTFGIKTNAPITSVITTAPSYNGTPYLESLYRFQVGNSCNMLVLVRSPNYTDSRPLWDKVNAAVEDLRVQVSNFRPAPAFRPRASAPAGVLGMVMGLLLPLICGVVARMVVNHLPIHFGGELASNKALAGLVVMVGLLIAKAALVNVMTDEPRCLELVILGGVMAVVATVFFWRRNLHSPEVVGMAAALACACFLYSGMSWAGTINATLANYGILASLLGAASIGAWVFAKIMHEHDMEQRALERIGVVQSKTDD